MKKLRTSKSKKLNPKKGEAYLFGPFAGELTWEFFRFAPYAIHLKKENPYAKIIVLTRQERFDLYGKYVDILVPLRIKDDKKYTQSAFGLLGYDINYYETISKFFIEKYNKEYNVIEHFYPNIRSWQRKIKWQFPRIEMDYDFEVRKRNDEIVDSIVGNYVNMVFVDKGYKYRTNNYLTIQYEDFITSVIEQVDNIKSTFLGCLISLLKRVEFTVGNLESYSSHLSILLKTPLISIDEKLMDDGIHLLNPLNTPIVKCSDVEEGVNCYENNFRSTKRWSWKQWGFLNTSEVWKHVS